MSKVLGSTVPHVNVADVKFLAMPLPSTDEQYQIIAEVSRRFNIIERLREAVEAAIERAEHLNQSILAQAFQGELVPQDPNDEPASILLERIRAERAKRETEAKVSKKSTGKTRGQRGKKANQQDLESIQLGLPGLE